MIFPRWDGTRRGWGIGYGYTHGLHQPWNGSESPNLLFGLLGFLIVGGIQALDYRLTRLEARAACCTLAGLNRAGTDSSGMFGCSGATGV